MTGDEARLLREFAKWLSAPERMHRLRELADAAWNTKATDADRTAAAMRTKDKYFKLNAVADEAVGKIARQYLCSLVEGYEANGGQESTPN